MLCKFMYELIAQSHVRNFTELYVSAYEYSYVQKGTQGFAVCSLFHQKICR